MGIVNLFTGSSGLNTKVDAVRVPYSPETGIGDLAVAINVVHDDSGRLGRRSGYDQLFAGGFHSLYSNDEECYVCEGMDLYRVEDDLSLSGVRSGLSGDVVDYADTPRGILYANGTQNGILREGVSSPWPTSTYVGPETSRYIQVPPVGQHIEFFANRVFIAERDVLWWTEPNAHGMVDMARNWVKFSSRIRMVKSVGTGLFVSTESMTYFLSGLDPAEFTRKEVAEYPALEFSDCPQLVEPQTFGMEGTEPLAVWASSEGIVLGLPQGGIINLTENKVRIPTGFSHGAVLIADTNVVSTFYY